ncbi:MAG: hypothetical protein KY476_09410 [Planctomycetes bacterium]|nr:hypothetical protein [Planctomycetota bacterium]
MRKSMLVTVAVSLLVVSHRGAAAGQADDARAIVGQAIEALGGPEALKKQKAGTWKEKGTYFGTGEDGVPYTGEYAVEWPSRFRMEISEIFTIVVNGDQGWIKSQDNLQEMTAEQLAEQKEELHSSYITTLLPLEEKTYKLSVIDGVEVDGKPTVGVKVSSEGHRDVKLYFDKETHLPAKSEYVVKSQEQDGKEVTEEVFYADYHKVEGLQVPKKVTLHRDGKKFVEAENSEFELGDVDDKLFAKPE